MVSQPIKIAAAAAISLSAFVAMTASACQDTSSAAPPEQKKSTEIDVGGGTGGTSGGSGGAGGAPGPGAIYRSCAYKPNIRPGYQNPVVPTPDNVKTSATPNIRRVRLGLDGRIGAGDPAYPDPSTSVVVGWQTDEGTTASTLWLSEAPDEASFRPENKAGGFTYTVPVDDKNIGAAAPQQLHEARACGLKPNTTYYYKVGGGPSGGEVFSDVLTFKTLPSTPDDKVVVAVTGDSRGQQGNAWQLLEERLSKRGDVQLQLFSGDMVNLGTSQMEYEAWLDKGERDTAGGRSMLGQVLTPIAMGNHENSNLQYFATVLQPHDPAYEDDAELYFSFDAGPLHVVVLDDLQVSLGRADYTQRATTWLDHDLGAVDRARTPWVVAVHHHPEFSASNHGQEKAVLRVRDALYPIWEKHLVDVVFTGHDHNYERSRPLSNGGKPADRGVTYVVCAGSGSEGYGNGTAEWTATSYKYDGDSLGVYGIAEVTKGKLTFTARKLAEDGSDAVVDSFELTK